MPLDKNRFTGDIIVTLFIKAAGTGDAVGNFHKYKALAYKGQLEHWAAEGEDPENFFFRLGKDGKPISLFSRTPRTVDGIHRSNWNPLHITHGVLNQHYKVCPQKTVFPGLVAPICDLRPDAHEVKPAGIRGEGQAAKARKKKKRTSRRWALEIIETRIFNIRKPDGTYVNQEFSTRKEAEEYLSGRMEDLG